MRAACFECWVCAHVPCGSIVPAPDVTRRIDRGCELLRAQVAEFLHEAIEISLRVQVLAATRGYSSCRGAGIMRSLVHNRFQPRFDLCRAHAFM